MPENFNLASFFLTDLLWISDFGSFFTFFFFFWPVFYLVFPSLSFCFLISTVQNTPKVYNMVLKLLQCRDAEMIIIFVLQICNISSTCIREWWMRQHIAVRFRTLHWAVEHHQPWYPLTTQCCLFQKWRKYKIWGKKIILAMAVLKLQSFGTCCLMSRLLGHVGHQHLVWFALTNNCPLV